MDLISVFFVTFVLLPWFVCGKQHLPPPLPIPTSFSPLAQAVSTRTSNFSWDNITPSKILTWHPCFGSPFECARLLVPIDYGTATQTSSHFALAMIRIPASKNATSRGPIILNPGGPGSSGVDQVLTQGEAIRGVVGEDFDLVSFDPRGANNTTPKITCVPNRLQRALWDAQDSATGLVLNSGTCARAEIGRKISRATVFGSVCEVSAGSALLENLGTPTTARDMLSIVEAHGETKLRYWGVSYGSVLGMTFAALFPDHVERIIVDGVVDAEDYYQAGWAQNLWDADKVVNWFFQLCSENPGKCAFARNATTATAVEQRFRNLVHNISEKPLVVPLIENPQLITEWDILLLLLTSLYTPLSGFQQLSDLLTEVEEGNGTSFVLELKPPTDESAICDGGDGSNIDTTGEELLDATIEIMCSDGALAEQERSVTAIEEYFKVLETESKWVSGVWGELTRLHCTGWKVNANWHVNGTFNANTSFPLLFIGNTFDPVTPLRGAKKMIKGFRDAALLVQDSYGHTSMSSPSTCTAKYIRAYFADGRLPPPNALCAVDDVPFKSAPELEHLTKQEETRKPKE